jgi:NAD(P)-dependent dehydrogenase (short-subunit alcohol dehydrogenase family)
MLGQGSDRSIINITSELTEFARPERTADIASKGACRTSIHAMALELPPHGIRASRAGA